MQSYLNTTGAGAISWPVLFLKQLPAWWLCGLLTPVLMYVYDLYPLDAAEWKKNLLRQLPIALCILLAFAVPRLWATHFAYGFTFGKFTAQYYLPAYLAQLAWDATVYVFIMLIIFAVKTNTRRKQNELYIAEAAVRNQELESKLNIAQLEALKLQLSPHFLFNTLHTINSLIRAGDNATAIKTTAALGDFLRTTLYAENAQFVPLHKEIEFAELYLQIELLRFNNRLTVKQNIAAGSLLIPVPYFILQPVIENAVKHGVAKQTAPATVSIDAGMSGGFLQITVYNDGPLLPANWQQGHSSSIGLQNVCSRLQKIYNGNYFFSIHNHAANHGVEVIIKIPLN